MKHLAAALVVITLIAASYLADANGFDNADSWGASAGVACLFFTILIFKKDN